MEEEEEEASVDEDEDEDEDEEERSLPRDPKEEVSTATRAKLLAERLKATALKGLRDLGRILAIGLLALAGRICVIMLCLQVYTQCLNTGRISVSTVQTAVSGSHGVIHLL